MLNNDLSRDYIWTISCIDSSYSNFHFSCCELIIQNFRKKHSEIGEIYADQLTALLSAKKSPDGYNQKEPNITDIP